MSDKDNLKTEEESKEPEEDPKKEVKDERKWPDDFKGFAIIVKW